MAKPVEFFVLRESSIPGKYMIGPKDYDKLPTCFNTKNGGSFHVAQARILGLPYHKYLIFLRQSFPDSVEVLGKGSIYPVAYWKKDKNAKVMVDLLNSKLTLALSHLVEEKKK